jgi:hypothetical protein
LECQPTTPSGFLSIGNSKNFKYNKAKYFWYLNDYLYFPNLDWDAVRIEGVFEDDISEWTCDKDKQCKIRQVQSFNVPDYLFYEVEANALKDLAIMYQLPVDTNNDNQHVLR